MTVELIERPAASEPTPVEQRRNERLHDQAVIRQGLRRLLAGRDEYHTLWDCGNPIPGVTHTTIERDSLGRITYANVVRCGSKQCCVVCAGPERAKDAALIAWRVEQHLAAGGGVSMLTVAPRHQAGERLAPMKAQLMEAFSDTMRSRPMRAVMADLGMIGTAKVFECTCGENGFHPHLHVLLFHAKFIDVTYGEEREFVHTFWRIFNEQLGKWACKACRHPKAAVAGVRYSKTEKGPSGRPKATYTPVTNAEWYGLAPDHTRDADLLHGINFVPITRDGDGGQRVAAYVGKIQLEMTRSDLKTGKTEGSRSVFQIMADYGHHPNDTDAALILEAIDVLKGTQLVSWSGVFNSPDPLYGEPTPEFRDAAIAEFYTQQGLEPPSGERETIAGIAVDVHRDADRARSLDGHPLLWKAKIVLEQTGQLEAVVQVLNEVLNNVILDRSPDYRYPLIRYTTPHDRRLQPQPTASVDRSALGPTTIDYEAYRARQRAELNSTTAHHPRPPTRAPGVERPAPPGGWLNYWKNASPEQINTALAEWEENNR